MTPPHSPSCAPVILIWGETDTITPLSQGQNI
jgi:hypothetical protein